MKRKLSVKKLLSVTLILTLLMTAFAGCGTKDKDVADKNVTPDSTEKAEGKKSEDEKSGQAKPGDKDTSRPVTLTWYLHGSNVTDDKEVLEKANEYLKEKTIFNRRQTNCSMLAPLSDKIFSSGFNSSTVGKRLYFCLYRLQNSSYSSLNITLSSIQLKKNGLYILSPRSAFAHNS